MQPKQARLIRWGGGRCTMKADGDNTILYLFVFDWPTDGKLIVPGLKNKIITSDLLANGSNLIAESKENNTIIKVPSAAPDSTASVIKLKVRRKN